MNHMNNQHHHHMSNHHQSQNSLSSFDASKLKVNPFTELTVLNAEPLVVQTGTSRKLVPLFGSDDDLNDFNDFYTSDDVYYEGNRESSPTDEHGVETHASDGNSSGVGGSTGGGHFALNSGSGSSSGSGEYDSFYHMSIPLTSRTNKSRARKHHHHHHNQSCPLRVSGHSPRQHHHLNQQQEKKCTSTNNVVVVVAAMENRSDCLVASMNDDGTVAVWDLVYNRLVFHCVGHQKPVTCLAWMKIDHHHHYHHQTRKSSRNEVDHSGHVESGVSGEGRDSSNDGRFCRAQKTNKEAPMFDLSLDSILISGSSDKTVKLWSLIDGSCFRTLTDHTSGVRVICVLDRYRFCSAGNDPLIHVWSSTGENLGVIKRVDDENIHQILPISNNRIVVASDNSEKMLYVYDTVHFCRVNIELAGHQDSIHCLVKINEHMFASASIDGVILLWNANDLSCVRKLDESIHATQNNSNNSDDMLRGPLRYVSHMSVINAKYLCAAVGKSICVFDIEDGECVLRIRDAHETIVVKIISLHNGNLLASCSEDTVIKIWNTANRFTVGALSGTSTKANQKDMTTPRKTSSGSVKSHRRRREKSHPELLGELPFHSDVVKDMIALSPYSFASCGADSILLVWRDTRIEKRVRSFYAYKYHSMCQTRQRIGTGSRRHSTSADSPRSQSDTPVHIPPCEQSNKIPSGRTVTSLL